MPTTETSGQRVSAAMRELAGPGPDVQDVAPPAAEAGSDRIVEELRRRPARGRAPTSGRSRSANRS